MACQIALFVTVFFLGETLSTHEMKDPRRFHLLHCDRSNLIHLLYGRRTPASISREF